MSSSSLQPFRELAQALREASENKDYPTLGRLLGDNLNPPLVDVLVYIRSNRGTITLIGAQRTSGTGRPHHCHWPGRQRLMKWRKFSGPREGKHNPGAIKHNECA
jgi:hypothetical protein